MPRKLSSAMRDAMMVIFLYENIMFTRYTARSRMWSVPKVKSIDIPNGRTIHSDIRIATVRALARRGMIKSTWKQIKLTERGFYRVKQWPEYEGLIVLKTIHDL